jgi:hypothetical protein
VEGTVPPLQKVGGPVPPSPRKLRLWTPSARIITIELGKFGDLATLSIVQRLMSIGVRGLNFMEVNNRMFQYKKAQLFLTLL